MSAESTVRWWLVLLPLLVGCPRQPVPVVPLSTSPITYSEPAHPSSQVIVPVGGGVEYGYPGGYQQRVPVGGGTSVVVPRDPEPARPSSQVIVPLGGGMEYGYPGGYQQRVPLGGGTSVLIPR